MINIKEHLIRFSLLNLSLIFLLFASCKETELNEMIAQQVPATDSRTEQTLDSIYLYAQQIYLWNQYLPSYKEFAPRQYHNGSDALSGFGEELLAIAAYAINPETNWPYEFRNKNDEYPKFSYIKEKDENSAEGMLSALNSTNTDYGFDMIILDDSIYVSYVKPASPADDAGLNRGDRVLGLNGNDLYELFSTASLNRIYNDAFNGASMDIEVRKADGEVIDTSITKATYEENPVYAYKVIEKGGSKVGYLAYGKFGETADAETYFADIFDEFAQEGIRDLVVDLRYNGGGFVSTAELLCNYILPSSENGKVLYSEEFNETMQNGEASILENQLYLDQNGDTQSFQGRDATYADIDYSLEKNTFHVEKEGPLETIERVYFIISGSTASASELVINALKPYVEVKTIGSTSFGKPVGFFPVTIDEYELYLTSFRTINANGESDYYQGLKPDIASFDDVSHDFGDVDEHTLNIALQALQVNVRTTPSAGKRKEVTPLGDKQSFKGMVENRLKLK